MVDWYLLGVFLYELLVGLPPFFNNDRNILFQNIKMGILRYPSWEISAEAKDLIEKVNLLLIIKFIEFLILATFARS